MSKLKRAIPILIFSSMLAIGCATHQEAAHKSNEMQADTGNAVYSLMDGIGAIVMWPFHLIGDLFT